MRRILAVVTVAAALAGCTTIRNTLPRGWFESPARRHPVRNVAILPFAYRGADDGRACDLCPDSLVMDETSAADALLVTAFVYEALTRHPRISLVPFEKVQMVESETMQATLTRLAATEDLDAVVVGALLELRPRLGDPREPYQRAGAALYSVLIDVRTGKPSWKRVYDRTPPRAGRARRQLSRLVEGEAPKALTAQEVAQEGARRMVASLVRAIR